MPAELTPPPVLAVSLEEVKAYLRIEYAHEDALLASLVRSATGLCEAFTGQALILRDVAETMVASTDWRRLSLTPVRAVDAVENDAGEPVSADNHAIDIDANGDGWVRMSSGRSEEHTSELQSLMRISSAVFGWKRNTQQRT